MFHDRHDLSPAVSELSIEDILQSRGSLRPSTRKYFRHSSPSSSLSSPILSARRRRSSHLSFDADLSWLGPALHKKHYNKTEFSSPLHRRLSPFPSPLASRRLRSSRSSSSGNDTRILLNKNFFEPHTTSRRPAALSSLSSFSFSRLTFRGIARESAPNPRTSSRSNRSRRPFRGPTLSQRVSKNSSHRKAPRSQGRPCYSTILASSVAHSPRDSLTYRKIHQRHSGTELYAPVYETSADSRELNGLHWETHGYGTNHSMGATEKRRTGDVPDLDFLSPHDSYDGKRELRSPDMSLLEVDMDLRLNSPCDYLLTGVDSMAAVGLEPPPKGRHESAPVKDPGEGVLDRMSRKKSLNSKHHQFQQRLSSVLEEIHSLRESIQGVPSSSPPASPEKERRRGGDGVTPALTPTAPVRAQRRNDDRTTMETDMSICTTELMDLTLPAESGLLVAEDGQHKDQIALLKRQLKNMKDRIQRQNAVNEELEAKYLDSRKVLSQLKARLEETESRLKKEVTEAATKVEMERADWNDEILDLRRQLQSAEEERDELRRLLDSSEAQLIQYRETTEQLQQEVEHWQKFSAEHEKCSELKGEVEVWQQTCREVEKKMQKKLKDTEKELEELQERKKQTEAENERLQVQTMSDTMDRMSQAELKTIRLGREEYKELLEKLESFAACSQVTEQKVEVLERETSDLESRIRNELDPLKHKSRQYIRLIKKLRDKLEVKRAELENKVVHTKALEATSVPLDEHERLRSTLISLEGKQEELGKVLSSFPSLGTASATTTTDQIHFCFQDLRKLRSSPEQSRRLRTDDEDMAFARRGTLDDGESDHTLCDAEHFIPLSSVRDHYTFSQHTRASCPSVTSESPTGRRQTLPARKNTKSHEDQKREDDS
ncbi:unnamed protein product [Cyprideis torosa]|uniref:Uncharacterized protein n=1 Tax=Cyprideis torosa TaxID=163714 RepID=A0A7R8W246_9CRUS|nr:unnamed protein product [Cyprideis torosa]CAG0881468.1 unnamed protein product [Cyprideis torosa]